MMARADAPLIRPLLGRPSVGHLLLLMATTGVAVWLMQAPSAATTVEALVSVGCAPFYGVALLALLVATIAFCRGEVESSHITAQPGHWLLLILGAGFSGVALFWRLLLILDSSRAELPPGVFVPAMLGIFFAVFLGLVSACLIFAALYEGVDEPRWRAVFWLLAGMVPAPLTCACVLSAIDPLGGAMESVVAMLFFGTVAATPLAAAVAAGRDVALRKRRDIWHWIGVACLFATVIHIALLALLVVPLQYART